MIDSKATITSPTSARRPKRPRASPSTPPYIVSVQPPAPAPLLRVFVPGAAASGNHMYINRKEATGQRKRIKVHTQRAAQWIKDVAQSVQQWRFSEHAPRPRLAVSCTFLNTKSDLDNLLKTTLDGLKIGLMVDDRYVVKLTAEKLPWVRNGERGAWIEVTQLPEKAATQPTQPRRRRTQPQRQAATAAAVAKERSA
jgi:Holliday junction resolvase RusA-like endonuclease